MDSAASRGRLDLLQWLHANTSAGCSDQALTRAIENGHLDIIQWLIGCRSECSNKISYLTMDLAASCGQLHALKWFYTNQAERCSVFGVDAAVRNGHLDVLKYLDAMHNFQDFCSTVNSIYWDGQLECCHSEELKKAATNGHYDVVRWLYAKRFDEFTQDTIDASAKAGYLKIVKFLHHFCKLKCSKTAFQQAISYQQFAVVEWLMKHNPSFIYYHNVPLMKFVPTK